MTKLLDLLVSMHMYTDCISNSANRLGIYCQVLYVHVYKWRKWHRKWNHSSSV